MVLIRSTALRPSGFQPNEATVAVNEHGVSCQIRTGVYGFAIRRLTTQPKRHKWNEEAQDEEHDQGNPRNNRLSFWLHGTPSRIRTRIKSFEGSCPLR